MFITIRAFAVATALILAAGCSTAPEMTSSTSRNTARPVVVPAATVPAATVEAVREPAPAMAKQPVAPPLPEPSAAPASKPVVSIAAAPVHAAVAAPSAAPTNAMAPAAPEKAPVVAEAKLQTQTIKGRLELLAGPRQSVAADEISEGLVYFLPEGGAPLPKPGRFTIGTHSKGFTPNHLVVPVGSTIAFPNRDTILHNVYSRTPGSTFDLGTFGPGQSKQTVLSKAGLVIVNCNVHHAMRANVVVLATPYYTRPGRDGSFQLKDLPVGNGTLVFWHPRATAGTLPLKGNRTAPVVQRLVATKARLESPSTTGN